MNYALFILGYAAVAFVLAVGCMRYDRESGDLLAVAMIGWPIALPLVLFLVGANTAANYLSGRQTRR